MTISKSVVNNIIKFKDKRKIMGLCGGKESSSLERPA
jgi:hypothetical protein